MQPAGNESVFELSNRDKYIENRTCSPAPQFALKAIKAGQARFDASVSFKVHLDPGWGAYWGGEKIKEPVIIDVVP